MTQPKPRITVLGSLNIDLLSYVSHHPLPGETMTASHFDTSSGGKGANQAVACAKLSRRSDLTEASADVSMIGAVGADPYGASLIADLKSYGVDTNAVTVVKEDDNHGKTGIAIIVVDEPTGQNRIILSPGANHYLQPGHFNTMPDPKPDILILQLEIPTDTVIQAIEAAKDASVPVLLNPAPAQHLPPQVYKDLAHLVLNETEAAYLAECPESDLEERSGLQRIGSEFLNRGVKRVVITLGGRGVYYADESGKSDLIPALKVNVVDTTAAGDTFIGAYALVAAEAAQNNQEFNIDLAIKRANRAASWTVAGKGAQKSIPWKNELEAAF